MAATWFASLPYIFRSYPEFLLASACLMFAFFYHQASRKPAKLTYWPVLGTLPGLLSNLGHLHDWSTGILRETGCTFEPRGPWFLGMDLLITCDPANVNHIFNVNFANYPKGDNFLEMLDILGDGIFNADGESWKSQRKMAHSVMSGPDFRALVARSSCEKVEEGLIPLMSKLAHKGGAIDLQDVFLRLTFDLTCSLVFGVDPGCLSEEFPTVPFARAMDDAMEAVFFRQIMPAPYWKLMRWLKLGREKRLMEAWKVIDQFVAESITEKRKAKKGKKNESLLTSYIEESSSSKDDKFLRDTAVNFMLAGRDTTGVALAWLFWLLAKNPRVKLKILEELKEDHSEEIPKSVYLHAALCESLRLYPPVPMEQKEPIQAETLPNGTRVRSKQRIQFNMYAMGRMEGIWGEDCLEFRPERWISERGKLRHEPSYKFLSFNCGPRTCLGKEIAFIQMKTAAAAMIRNFDVELIDGHVVEPKLSIILHMKNGLKVRIKQRK